MPEQLTVSPLLDGFTVGSPVGNHFGVRCYPAVRADSPRKYIVKAISIPASQTQLDALLITGAYKDSAEAAEYFRSLANEIAQETALLRELSRQEGFIPYEGCQVEPMQQNRIGYEVFLLSGFRLSLERYMHRHTVSHLEAVNLGIDLCTALAACRKTGMLYVDLKPSNIFISNKKEYKIGDLGFIPLNALKYTPMPEKYRSSYTAPELMDDLSVLNETADTYCVGMILYQIFNNGALPQEPDKPLPAPATADDEMAGILQKACDPDPAKRWEDPAQMRQALIDYMQRGTINDVPIMDPITGTSQTGTEEKPYQTTHFPAPAEESTAEEAAAPAEAEPSQETAEHLAEAPEDKSAPDAAAEESAAPAGIPEAPADASEVSAAESAIPDGSQEEADAPAVAAPPPEEASEEAPEGSFQLQFSETEAIDTASVSWDLPEEATPPASEEPAQAQPEQAASDLSFSPDDIDDAVAAEFAGLTGGNSEDSAWSTPIGDEDLDKELQALSNLLRSSEKPVPRERKQTPNVEPVVVKPPKKKRSAVGILSVILLLCLVLAGSVWGYMYYTSEYLQTVNGMTVQEEDGKLIVQVDSGVRDGLLSVVCTDAYGNSFTQAVQNGKAEFTKINAGTFYTVQVQISGLHKLTEPVSQVFTTAGTTTVTALNAATGTQDGSVAISMIVEGAEPDQWQVYYSADGEPELVKTFTGHSVTLENLSIGKLYTFRLEVLDGIKHTPAEGQNTVQFTPVQIIGVRDLSVVSYQDGVLTVEWGNTASVDPEAWIVHCSGEGYDQTEEFHETRASFSGLSEDKSYNVDVYAKGMTQFSRLSVSANPVTLTGFQVDDSDRQSLKLNWQYAGNTPEGSWQVIYTLDGSDLPSAATAEGASATVAPRIPGATYHFTIQLSDGTSVFGGTQDYACPAAADYSGHGMTRSGLSAKLLVTPAEENWVAGNIPAESFVQSFTVGQAISVLLQNSYSVYLDDEQINILYVFRDAQGQVAPELIGEETRTWREMFGVTNSPLAGLNVPTAPTAPGNYTLDIYFNGTAAASVSLSIT